MTAGWGGRDAFSPPPGRATITEARETATEAVRTEAYRLARAYRCALRLGVRPGETWELEAGTLLEIIGEGL